MASSDGDLSSEEAERVRKILEPQDEEDRKKRSAALKAAEKEREEARERQKTASLAGWLLLAVLATVIVALVSYLMG